MYGPECALLYQGDVQVGARSVSPTFYATPAWMSASNSTQ